MAPVHAQIPRYSAACYHARTQSLSANSFKAVTARKSVRNGWRCFLPYYAPQYPTFDPHVGAGCAYNAVATAFRRVIPENFLVDAVQGKSGAYDADAGVTAKEMELLLGEMLPAPVAVRDCSRRTGNLDLVDVFHGSGLASGLRLLLLDVAVAPSAKPERHWGQLVTDEVFYDRPSAPGGFAVPPLEAGESVVQHRQRLADWLQQLGYEPHVVACLELMTRVADHDRLLCLLTNAPKDDGRSLCGSCLRRRQQPPPPGVPKTLLQPGQPVDMLWEGSIYPAHVQRVAPATGDHPVRMSVSYDGTSTASTLMSVHELRTNCAVRQ